MNEREWRKSNDTYGMLNYLEGQVSDRKLRLFAVTCCRRVWDMLTDRRSREAVAIVEKYADGRVDEKELGRAYQAAWAVDNGQLDGEHYAARAAARATWQRDEFRGAYPAHEISYDIYYIGGAKWSDMCDLLREIFGNPFRPIAIDPAWRTPQALALARTTYEERRFEDLPLLADALEEAGCTDAAILTHLRGPGPHVCGCWVVDLVLGRS